MNDDWKDLGKNKNVNPESSNLDSEKTEKNVDRIQPAIDRITQPVVIFFGPKDSGKTVVLLRLASFLGNYQDISLKINREFRTDPDYDDVIKKFEENISNLSYSPPRTLAINFLLLDIFKGNEPLCQILEAPGEHFFDVERPSLTGFRRYLSTILSGIDNKKIIVIFFEPGMLKTPEMRVQYSNRLKLLISKLDLKRDKLIVLYNKVDKKTELFKNGEVNRKAIKDEIFNIESFSSFKNTLLSNRRLKRVQFLPFSSGEFYDDPNGSNVQDWSIGNNKYPKELWQNIQECLKKTKWTLF